MTHSLVGNRQRSRQLNYNLDRTLHEGRRSTCYKTTAILIFVNGTTTSLPHQSAATGQPAQRCSGGFDALPAPTSTFHRAELPFTAQTTGQTTAASSIFTAADATPLPGRR